MPGSPPSGGLRPEGTSGPSLSLRAFGAPDIRDDGDNPVRSLLAQPKRVALLLYLLGSKPGEYCPRDRLLSLFWPEFDDERARNSLRTALYYLRRSVGPNIVVSRGDGALAVDPNRIRYDVWAFQRALTGERWKEAVELFRGEFLQGFFIGACPEFERWSETLRTRFRRAAGDALWQCSVEGENAGDLDRAVALMRRSLGLFPANEQVLRRLLLLLGATGDRGAALQAYDGFARRLEEDFGLEPADETLEVVEKIRRLGEGSGPVPRPGAAATSPHSGTESDEEEDGTAPEVPATGEPAADSGALLPTWLAPRPAARSWLRVRRIARSRAFALAVAPALLLAGGHLATSRAGGSGAFSPDVSPLRVMVVPFSHAGTARTASAVQGIGPVISAALESRSGVRAVAVAAVRDALEDVGPGGPGLRAIRRAARSLGAGRVVTGSVLEVGDQVRIDAALLDVDGGALPLARSTAEGPIGSFPELLEEVADGLAPSLPRPERTEAAVPGIRRGNLSR